jgi:hypothetical protein
VTSPSLKSRHATRAQAWPLKHTVLNRLGILVPTRADEGTLIVRPRRWPVETLGTNPSSRRVPRNPWSDWSRRVRYAARTAIGGDLMRAGGFSHKPALSSFRACRMVDENSTDQSMNLQPRPVPHPFAVSAGPPALRPDPNMPKARVRPLIDRFVEHVNQNTSFAHTLSFI